jgi:antitoxin StbD
MNLGWGIMETIFAKFSASISELKKNPSALIEKAQGNPVTILNRNKPTAYLIPAATYDALLERIEDHELGQIILERQAQKDEAIEVCIDDL